jgi:hypothetical protein
MQKAGMTIGLKADLEAGEGEISDLNRDKLNSLLENPLLALDVIGDWLKELAFYHKRAEWAFCGEMWRVGQDAGHHGPPTIDDLRKMYDDKQEPYNETILADDFCSFAEDGFDLQEAWMEFAIKWARGQNQSTANGKVLPFCGHQIEGH